MLEVKKSPGIFVVWVAVIALLGACVLTGKITWPIAGAFLVALGLPSFLGAKKTDGGASS